MKMELPTDSRQLHFIQLQALPHHQIHLPLLLLQERVTAQKYIQTNLAKLRMVTLELRDTTTLHWMISTRDVMSIMSREAKLLHFLIH